MRKGFKKLSLNRETVRNLQGSDYPLVVGGSARTSCECLIATGCDCASQGGPDCYPPSACLGTCSW